MTLQETAEQLCAKHDLTALSLGMNVGSPCGKWAAYVHWDGGCTSGMAESPEQAISYALAEMQAERAPIIGETIQIGEVAA